MSHVDPAGMWNCTLECFKLPVCRNSRNSLCVPLHFHKLSVAWHIPCMHFLTDQTHCPKWIFSADMGCLCFDVPPRLHFCSDSLKVNPWTKNTCVHIHTYAYTHRVHCVPGASGGKMRATKRLIRLTSISHTLSFPLFLSPTLLFTSYPLLAVPFAWVSSNQNFLFFITFPFLPSISKVTSLRTLP